MLHTRVTSYLFTGKKVNYVIAHLEQCSVVFYSRFKGGTHGLGILRVTSLVYIKETAYLLSINNE